MREEIYLAGLLHDIGKFVERTKDYKIAEPFKEIKTGHAKHSAQVMYTLMKNSEFFSQYNTELVNLVGNHHEAKSPLEKIIQLADWLSSSEREKDINTDIYYTVPLKPIFLRVFEKGQKNLKKLAYPIASLNFESIFPKEDISLTTYDYRKVVNSFFNELGMVNQGDQIYYLLEKYLWSVPAQTTNYVPDISLFDHARTTAAIALCLYDQYECGELTLKDLQEMDKSLNEQFILINGDISGIQDFIFSIPTKGAAKSLKGRSMYISLLTEVVVQSILDCLDLKEANVLYSGGGNFYILAPKCKEKQFLDIRKKILHSLLKAHQRKIYLAMDYIFLAPADFKHFNLQWDKVKEKNNIQKSKKWSELGLEENYEDIFGPFDDGTAEKNHCQICGVAGQKRKLNTDPENGVRSCFLCQSFIELTNQLRTANYLLIDKIYVKNSLDKKDLSYNDILGGLGYKLQFCSKLNQDFERKAKVKVFKLNDTEFINSNCNGFKMGSLKLPFKEGKQIGFDELAERSKGDWKLGYLKLDVDNLGNIFARGFEDNRSISRLATLSRMLRLFFEGYINHLIKKKGWEEDLYVVFSGGDDTFIIGPWNIVIDFTQDFYQKFREYSCYNEKITFSAGFGAFPEKFPLNRAAEFINEGLDQAKKKPSKDSICFLGEVFNWDEFSEVKNIKELLIKMVNFHNKNKKDTTSGRTLLYKLQKNTLCFHDIKKDKSRNKFEKLKLWRLAYSLREIREADLKTNTDFAERFIKEYDRIVVDNLTGKSKEDKINNIMIIPAAIKWAQLETRKVRRNRDEG